MASRRVLKIRDFICALAVFGMTSAANGYIATFDDLPLAAESYWNGSDGSGGFSSGAAQFNNNYDATWGFWDGFSYSNITDTLAEGMAGQFNAITGTGQGGSANYGVSYVGWAGPSTITLNAAGIVEGLYVTNNNSAYYSMLNGDSFAKKFGGVTGDDEDWFVLTITGKDAGGAVTEVVEFYLADYRFADNGEDYIVDAWEYVDLSELGVVKSLEFGLISSDVGPWGMNTPAYFAIDTLGEVGGVGDLTVTSVSTEATGVAGKAVHVEWDVFNDYTEEKIGPGFLDAVYLSSDKEWDINDIILAIIEHNESVEPQTGYHAETDVVLPGVLPGRYYVLVRTDFGNLVYEPDGEYNNIASTDANMVVDVEELIIGTPTDSNFVETELSRYFRVTVAAGEDVEIRLDDLDDAGSNELYASFERIPRRSQFDYRYERSFASDRTVRIPGTRSGTYYILAYGSNLAGSGVGDFTIGVQYMPLEITEITPMSGGNAGTVTATIQGARFKSSTTTKLIGADGAIVTGELQKLTSTMEMVVAFDLRGAQVGLYDIEVKNTDSEAFVTKGGFEVVETELQEIRVDLVVPEVARAGSNGVFYIDLGNPGLNDTGIPVIWAMFLPSMKASLISHETMEIMDEILVDVPEMELPFAVLSPGEHLRIPVYFQAPLVSGDVVIIALEVLQVPEDEGTYMANALSAGDPLHDTLIVPMNNGGKLTFESSGHYDFVSRERSGWFWSLLTNGFPEQPKGLWQYSFGPSAYNEPTAANTSLQMHHAGDSHMFGNLEILVNPSPYWIQTVKTDVSWWVKPLIWANPGLFSNWLYEGVDHEIGSPKTTPLVMTDANKYHDYSGRPTAKMSLLALESPRNMLTGRRWYVETFKAEVHPAQKTGSSYSIEIGKEGLEWGYDIKVTYEPPPTPPDSKTFRVLRSFDPNIKIRPKGHGSSGLVLPGQLMVYTVHFENEPNASAAALEVRIEDQLDEDLDWTTFELLEIGFGDYAVTIPDGMSHYETRLDVNGWTWSEEDDWHTGETPLMADISVDIDISTGKATWHMTSYDPNTGWGPEDAYAGFLPPDDANDITHRGEGYVSFAVRPKVDSPAGTLITNSARIFFDENPPIETPATSNIVTIDLADLDLSGEIDFGDIARLAEEWLWAGLPGTVDEDIVVDGIVNFLDYVKVAEKWLSP